MAINHNTSTQQRRAAACLPRARRRMSALSLPFPNGEDEANEEGPGRLPVVRPPLNENKLAVAAEMETLGHPVTAEEIQEALEELLPLAAIDYHLSTLVRAGIVKPLFGPEIYFQHVSQKAVPSALTESKRTEP